MGNGEIGNGEVDQECVPNAKLQYANSGGTMPGLNDNRPSYDLL